MVIIQKVTTYLGSPAGTNKNYTRSCFSRWGMTAALGFTKSSLAALREDAELSNILDVLRNYEGSMLETQTSCIGDKIARAFMSTGDDAASLGSSKIVQMAPFMKHLNDTMLNMLNTTVRPVLCQGFASANTGTLSLANIKRLKNFCLANILRDDTGEVTDRTSASERDDNDIRDLGNLLCGLETSDMTILTQE